MALKSSAAQMVANARARIEEFETSDAIAMVDDPNVQIVDLRDPREQRWSREFGPFVKVDHVMREVIQNDEAKEPFCGFQGACRA